jgi:glycosyltransferase involved in cell wall biosynthesis
LDRPKGLSDLLAAAQLVPEAFFVLAGEGREREILQTRARALGIANRVSFLGHRNDIPDLLASCDVFVLPSLYEGLPVSVLEAMAAGKPVVATAVGGTCEVVLHGQTGLLVPPRDPAALARAIRTLLADPDLVQQLTQAAKVRLCQKFRADTMVERIADLYDELAPSNAA